MDSAPRLLVDEDDAAVREGVAAALSGSGYSVRTEPDGAELSGTVASYRPDLAILDVGLPRGPDGFHLGAWLRAETGIPIVYLTAADALDERLRGFDAGADDYLVKPFSMAELLARVRAVLRRGGRLTSATFEIRDVLIDEANSVVRRAGQIVELTKTEFDLLCVMAREPGRVFSKVQLLSMVWGFDQYEPAPGHPGGDKVASWFGGQTLESAQGSRRADDAFLLLDRIHEDQTQRFERFLASIDGKGTPFHFLHLVLPHAPWHYLPDGTEYDDRPLGMVDYLQRTSEPWPALVNRQRHILQTMSVDRLVGTAVARLKQVGLYDRATVLLTADHGMSFAPAPPGATRRMVPENQHEVAWVPFMLKAPGQTSGELRDDNVMGVDVAPTLAALAGVRIPWEVDGISLIEGRREGEGKGLVQPARPATRARSGRLHQGAGGDAVSNNGSRP